MMKDSPMPAGPGVGETVGAGVLFGVMGISEGLDVNEDVIDGEEVGNIVEITDGINVSSLEEAIDGKGVDIPADGEIVGVKGGYGTGESVVKPDIGEDVGMMVNSETGAIEKTTDGDNVGNVEITRDVKEVGS